MKRKLNVVRSLREEQDWTIRKAINRRDFIMVKFIPAFNKGQK